MRKEQVLIPLVRQIIKRPALAGAFFRLDRWGNPFTDEVIADPMILAGPMRDDGPVYWHGLYQQWFVMGYDEAREVLNSPHVGTQNQADVLLAVSPYTKLSKPTRTFLRKLLLLTDPPAHTRQRALVSRAFTPRQVSRLEEPMIELVEQLLGDFGDDVELMRDFASVFPAMVITELVGFDPSEYEWLRNIAVSLIKITDPFFSFEPAELDAAVDSLRARTLELAAERRANPKEDVLSGLVQAEQDGDRLSEDELVSMVGLILIAGFETTASMLGLGVLHLHDNPSQLQRLRDEPALWPKAVEEILRFDPTLRTDPRTALADFELAGNKIKKGQNLVVITQLANRDLRRMPDADEFRVDREDPSLITFGHGIHYCLGAALARAELRIALPRLVEKLEGYELDRANVTWKESLALRGPATIGLSKR